MEKRCRGNYVWLTGSRKRLAVLAVLNIPMIKKEIEEKTIKILGLSEKSNVRISEFTDRNILKCLNPGTSQGKIYGVTEYGQKLVKRICKELDCIWHYSDPEIDWNLYGWLVGGKRRKKVFTNIIDKGNVDTKEIARDMPRSYRYKLINEFLKNGLLTKSIENNIIFHSLSIKGKKIANIMF